jgi:hypothetical protein
VIPQQLLDEVEGLRAEGYFIEPLEADGWANLLFAKYPLPGGYSKVTSDLLLKFPLSYPNGKPDMFWVEPDVTLANGKAPQSAEAIETAIGRTWRRFSWHLQNWNPGRDNARTYLDFVNARLAKGH